MRETFLTGIFLFWLVLAGIATAFVAVRGIEWPIVAIAAGLCIFPVITTLPVAHGGRHWPRGRRAMLVCLPWILMSSVFVAASGGMASPALVFVVFPSLFALAFGWKKLAVETSVFALIATLMAVLVSNDVSSMPGAASLAKASEMYALAGLCLLPFLVAGFVRQEELKAGPDPAASPVSHLTMPRANPSSAGPVVESVPSEGPAAGLDPIDGPGAGEPDGEAIIDVTREGRIRSVSGAVPRGLQFRVGRVFVDSFPPAMQQPVATGLNQGGSFVQALGDGRAISLTVDRHDLGVRVFMAEAEANNDNEAQPSGAQESADAAGARAELAERTAFFAGLSHELKTPLNAILGFADIMQSELRGPMPEAYKDYSSLIHDSGQDLLLMVEDILDYAKTEAGHSRFDSEPVDLVASGESVIAQLSGQAQRADVEVKLLAKGEVWAQADPRAVRQIWQNLLSNAIKYSDKGGTVTLDAKTGKTAVALSVRDEGAGMDKEDLDRIARPFQQGSNSRGRAGTGLGLAVVKSFADAMKGRVVIDTAPGQGTRVRVVLPKANADDVSAINDAAE